MLINFNEAVVSLLDLLTDVYMNWIMMGPGLSPTPLVRLPRAGLGCTSVVMELGSPTQEALWCHRPGLTWPGRNVVFWSETGTTAAGRVARVKLPWVTQHDRT